MVDIKIKRITPFIFILSFIIINSKEELERILVYDYENGVSNTIRETNNKFQIDIIHYLDDSWLPMLGNEIINDKPRELFVTMDNFKCILEKLYNVKNIVGVTEYDVCYKNDDIFEVNDVDYLKGIYTNDGAIISITWITFDSKDYLCEIEIYTSDDSINLMLSDEMNDMISRF